MQSHSRVLIVDDLDLPRLDLADRDADLFHQLTAQRRLDSFAGLEFSARKLPVPGVDLALGPRGQQELALGVYQHADRHVNGHAIFGSAHA